MELEPEPESEHWKKPKFCKPRIKGEKNQQAPQHRLSNQCLWKKASSEKIHLIKLIAVPGIHINIGHPGVLAQVKLRKHLKIKKKKQF
jgi:hypothetical protein